MINKKDILRLSVYARIGLRPEEAAALQRDMEAILGYVEKLKEAGGLETDEKFYNALRQDATPHERGAFTEALLDAAPRVSGGYVEVRNVFGRNQHGRAR